MAAGANSACDPAAMHSFWHVSSVYVPVNHMLVGTLVPSSVLHPCFPAGQSSHLAVATAVNMTAPICILQCSLHDEHLKLQSCQCPTGRVALPNLQQHSLATAFMPETATVHQEAQVHITHHLQRCNA